MHMLHNPDLLITKAKQILALNWNGHFTKPAPSLYPHQWNWDTGFIAIGYAHYDITRAITDLSHLFSGQWTTGMLPQIVFGQETSARYFPGPDFWQSWRSPHAPRQPLTSGITMPPVHGLALWWLVEHSEERQATLALIEPLFPKVVALHHYLYTYRDPHEEGLAYIRHPWESGTDNSPVWDKPLSRIQIDKAHLPAYQRQDLQTHDAVHHRPTDTDYDRYVWLVDLFRHHNYDDTAIEAHCPFLVQDPLFNAILAWSNECLVALGGELGQDMRELLEWNELTIFSLNKKLWHPAKKRYAAYDLVADEHLPTHSTSAFMPLIAGAPDLHQARLLLEQLDSAAFSGTAASPTWLYPTFSIKHSAFDPKCYWRGPVWININWLLYQGLMRYGLGRHARRLKEDTIELLHQFGFCEYFDPRRYSDTQKGYGTTHFSWSAALCIDLLSH